jgi:hypothetical protein
VFVNFWAVPRIFPWKLRKRADCRSGLRTKDRVEIDAFWRPRLAVCRMKLELDLDLAGQVATLDARVDVSDPEMRRLN